jgi:hypothetical protein
VFCLSQVFQTETDLVTQKQVGAALSAGGAEMTEMGRQFKAPAQTDVKQWRNVEALVRGGITFHTQRLYSLRNMPKVLREVAPFLRRVRTPKLSDGARLLSSTPRKRRKRIAA